MGDIRITPPKSPKPDQLKSPKVEKSPRKVDKTPRKSSKADRETYLAKKKKEKKRRKKSKKRKQKEQKPSSPVHVLPNGRMRASGPKPKKTRKSSGSYLRWSEAGEVLSC